MLYLLKGWSYLKIAIVLNFNNYKSTLSCTNSLIKSGVNKIIIVDNASTNGSYEKLEQKYAKEKNINTIKSAVNQGYATGNNIGLQFAERNYGLNNIIFIVNPDTIVNKKVIDQVSKVIKNNPNAGMVTTKVNGTMSSVWKHTGLVRGFIFNFWLINTLLYKFGIMERKIYEKGKDNIQKVEVVSGAFFGISQKKFKKVGYFDNNTFLYYEEEILSYKLRKSNLQNYCINNLSYKHAGQSSTHIAKLQLKIINDKSRLYFLKKYEGAGPIYSCIYKLINLFDNQFLKFYYD